MKVKHDLVMEDMEIPGDLRTARIVQQVANTICPFIQVTIDCPSMQQKNLMPILDLEVGVNDNIITYQHYMKPCANPLVILNNSAMPYRSKRICLVQEVIRILRNTSRKLPIETRNMLLSRFSFRMMESGYSETMREEVITSGVSGYQKQVERDEAGQCPLYRPKGFQESE